MRKGSFKKISFILLLLSFLLTKIVLGQDKSVELQFNFTNADGDVVAKTDTYKLKYKNSSPFVMLSGYTNNLSFNQTVYYRLKLNDTWSDWKSFKQPHKGEDMDRFVLGEVFIERAFNEIQFKTDQPTETKFTFRLFFPEFTKNLLVEKVEKTANKQSDISCAQPEYQNRNDWCPAGNCPKSNSSVINPTHIVIHHSAGQTNSSDYAAVVRGYWDYHVNTNGWADIGYNWLVDPNGILYEGRGDRVRGAHSPCMNGISTGICFIGNYENFQMSQTGLNAFKDFIAWDATDKRIDIKSSSMVSGLGLMDHLSGHKDGKDTYPSSNCSSTLCPGANLHDKINIIKNDVANYSCYISSFNAPETPVSFRVIRKSATSVEVKIKSVATASKYGVYRSSNNTNFQKVTESSSSTILIDNLTEDQVNYFKVEAINDDGVSEKSSVLAAIPSQYPSKILIIDGVERRKFDAIVQYDYPLSQLGHSFSSATNDAVQDGSVILSDFKFVIWMLLDESSADNTLNKTEQSKIKSFIDNEGVFIISGDEIGWDLVYFGDNTDKLFYANYLKAAYIADNPTPNNKKVKDNNNTIFNLDDGSHGTFNADFPDLIKPINGSLKTFTYDGVNESDGIAAVSYQTTSGGVEYLGFAIELVYDDTQRKKLIEYILQKYSSALDVKDNLIQQNIRLYPNPTSGIIKISNPNYAKIKKINIYNIYGQQLAHNSQNNIIDLSFFPTGIYIVKIEDENGKQGAFKVIKE